MKKLMMILMAALLLVSACACAAPAAAPAATADPDVLAEAEASWTLSEEALAEEPAAEPAAEDDLAYITGKGNMVIGITIFEPMNYYEGEKLVGFDTEFAEAVCAKLGVTPEFIEINWDTKETELASKNIDCIWNGLTITEDRKANMEITDPYIKNMQVVVVKAANAANLATVEALGGANLVAEMGSAGETVIKEDAVLSGANFVAVAKQTDALLEVKAGTADACVLDYTLAKSMVGEGTDFADLQMVDGLELAVEEYGVAFRKGSNVAAAVNEQITALTGDGTMDKIAETYGLTDSLLSNQ
ncbi:MAG: transporter substrate-binding domain-containing protein [Clostridia bacterium]|nr:transporter substrate-binding domain-containing protein [Clostridia bacterium]